MALIRRNSAHYRLIDKVFPPPAGGNTWCPIHDLRPLMKMGKLWCTGGRGHIVDANEPQDGDRHG